MRLTPAAALAVLFGLACGSAQARVSSLRWQRPIAVDRQGGGLVAISCPSTKLCVAVDSRGHVVTSTAPAGPASAWRATSAHLPSGTHGRVAIDCLSTRLCAVADDTHNLFVSTRPAGGASSWRSVPVDPAAAVTSVSCPSTALCVAVDDRGDVLSTTTPTGGAPVWSSERVDPAADNGEGGIHAVSCPSAAFCAAVDDQGNVLTSSDPVGGAAAWRTVPVYTGIGSAGGLLGLSCPSPHLCAAVDGSYGDVLTSTDPSGGSKAWKGTQISPGINQNDAGSLDLIHCDFTTICIAADNLRHVYSSTHPTAGGPAWSTAEFELADVSCPTRSLCVAVEGGGSVRLARLRA